MLTLAIETSCNAGGVAFIRDGLVLGEATLVSRETHSRRLVVTVEWLMERLAVGWEEIDLVTAGLGPGSFTGLRIGLSTAKGLCFALGVPIVGVPTLDALAHNVSAREGDVVCPLLDARKSQVYTAFYRCASEGMLTRISDYLVLDPGDFPRAVPAEGFLWLLGDGLSLYGERILSKLTRRWKVPEPHLNHVRAAPVGILGERTFLEGKTGSLQTLKPLYVRASEAEINKRKRRGNK